MIYLDTSFLAPIYIAEPTSDRIESLLLNQPDKTLAISHWTRVENAQAIWLRDRGLIAAANRLGLTASSAGIT